MNFLGVGPFELLLILIFGLIVLGPERLQQMGRSAGRLVARVLAWQQQSPEAQMVQQIQRDFQQEINELRTELVNARKQLNVSSELQQLRQDTDKLIANQQTEQTPVSEITEATPQSADPSTTQVPEPDTSPPVQPGTVEHMPRAVKDRNGQAETVSQAEAVSPPSPEEPPATEVAPPAPAPRHADKALDADFSGESPADELTRPAPELESLSQQIQALVADMHALQKHLHDRGVLDQQWQPPSEHPEPATTEETVSS
jgi:sec-independent protein translocase protein TatB